TYITLMAEAGAPITYVQDQVGHESARLTLEIYARVSRSRDRARWGRAFDELMSGAVPLETSSDDQLHRGPVATEGSHETRPADDTGARGTRESRVVRQHQPDLGVSEHREPMQLA